MLPTLRRNRTIPYLGARPMNMTKAACGHEVVAVGLPGSSMRHQIEHTKCVTCRLIRRKVWIVESNLGDVIQCFDEEDDAKTFKNQLNEHKPWPGASSYSYSSYTVK